MDQTLKCDPEAGIQPMHASGDCVYWPIARREVDRVLSFEDREPHSGTYGCFDRVHWCWKFTDFPGARFQEGAFTLSWLFTSPMANATYGNPRILDWLTASLDYWSSIQYPDGSFDEAYPYEHSLAATAFTSFYVGEAYLRVIDHLDPELKDRLNETFGLAGDWMCRNDETHGVLSNHLAAAAAGLHNIARITGESRFEHRSEYFVDRILAKQSCEGWYEEYGGADPGYQTHATFYLAWIWQQTRKARLLASLTKAIEFQRFTIHPNGTLGGEYGSRGTEFYYPAGFEILASHLDCAASVALALRTSAADQMIAGPATMDSYNIFPLLNNYLFAAESTQTDLNRSPLPCENLGDWSFPEAGLHFKSTPAYYGILSTSKGGVVRVYDKTTNELAMSDCGYWAESSNGVISSQSMDRTNAVQQSDDSVEVRAPFVSVNQRTMQPHTFVLFRLFTITLGRWQRVAYAVKQLLVKVLVSRRKQSPAWLTRTVEFGEERVVIKDRIESESKLRFQNLTKAAKFLTIHMGSSRYFQSQELDLPESQTLSEAVARLNAGEAFEHTSHWQQPDPEGVAI